MAKKKIREEQKKKKEQEKNEEEGRFSAGRQLFQLIGLEKMEKNEAS